jgi:hypothetical protein
MLLQYLFHRMALVVRVLDEACVGFQEVEVRVLAEAWGFQAAAWVFD